MTTQLVNGLAEYRIGAPTHDCPIGPGQTISIRDTGKRFCCVCNRPTRSLFGQGLCFPCFKTGPENSECIIRPALCQGHLGRGRDPDWERRHHVQPHVVYIANSGGIKVGVTRQSQIPTRWIDQGASDALIIAETPNRYEAGCIEVALTPSLGDKTHWQRMLKGMDQSLDLHAIAETSISTLPSHLKSMTVRHLPAVSIRYPVTTYPTQVKSIKLDKHPVIEGKIIGIRGQYLILDNNRVLNIRNHSGIEVELLLSYNSVHPHPAEDSDNQTSLF